MNAPVSFPIAKLLKEKEYKDKNVLGTVRLSEPKYYDPNGIIHGIKDAFEENDYKIEDCFNAPTIADVVMWLYVKHGIWIYPLPIDDDMKLWQARIIKGEPFNKLNNTLKIISYGEISYRGIYSPTEAYEAAINYTLNNLI